MPNPSLPNSPDLASITTLADLFSWRVASTPLAEAYREADPTGRWNSVTWQGADERVARFASALARKECRMARDQLGVRRARMSRPMAACAAAPNCARACG